MRKSNTLGGIIDKLEFCEAELNSLIGQLKHFEACGDHVYNILYHRNLALRILQATTKRMLE